MDFMSTVREKASAIAIGAVKTSGAVVETVKSNFAIADKEQETTKLLRELGTLMYEAYKESKEVDADKVAEKCVQLDQYLGEIEELREKVKGLRNLRTCPVCKSSVKAEHKFCPNCGAEMKEEDAEAEAQNGEE